MNTSKERKPRTTISRTDRLSLVEQRHGEGKSVRQIAKELECDKRTIADDLKILALLPEEREAIVRGEATAAQAFRSAERRRHREAEQKQKLEESLAESRRRHDEAERACSMRHTAQLGIRCLRKVGILPRDEHQTIDHGVIRDAQQVLEEVARHLWKNFTCYPTPARDQHWAIVQRLRPPLPEKPQMPDLISNAAEWLYKSLLKIEPDRELRDGAIHEALRIIKAMPKSIL